MSVHIDWSNYEEFYLDYLEGNLSGDAASAFEAFLQANPDLVIDDDLPTVLQLSDEVLDPVTRLSLKQSPGIDELSAETLDYFLIAQQEGLLSATENAQLDHWLNANSRYRNDERLMQLSTLQPSVTDVYTAKSQLKQPEGRVIALPVWLGSIAAAAGLAFFLTMSNWSPAPQPQGSTPIAKAPHTQPVVTTDNTSAATPAAVTGTATAAVHQMAPARQYGTAVQPLATVDPLQKRELTVATPRDLSLVALHIEKTPEHQALPTVLNDLAHIKNDEMRNPIEPITDRLTTAFNREVDFRTAKAAKKRGGGFYLKIGKLEISHHSASL